MFPLPQAFMFAVAISFGVASSAASEPLEWKQLAALPEPLGVAAPFAGVSGGALIVAGGANFPNGMPWDGGKKVWTDRLWALEKSDGAWREAGRLPRPLAYGVSATSKRGVVCVGGSDSERHYAEAFLLEWRDGRLATEPLPSFPIPISAASWAMIDQTLYVACGSEQPGEQSATNRAFSLDLSDEKPSWQELPPLPGKPRFLAAGAAHGGAFYLFGGAALQPSSEGKMARVYLREAWVFRPGAGWKQLSDLPKPCVAPPSPAPVIDGNIHLLGGDDGSLVGFQPVQKHPGFPGTTLAYDPKRDRWAEAGTAPAPRATVPCVEWSGRFVIPSGEMRPGVRSPQVWTLSTR